MMRSPFSHFWICIAACAALVACETPDDDPSPPDADVPDASIGAGGMGGEGGEGGMGGEGGVGGEGGMGGTGGVPEGDCAEIEDEAGCEARDDCAPRRDAVEGAFVDCRPLGDVPCSMLSGADCDRRDDCEMDGELCSPLPVECADHPDARTCASAGCHWWDDGCHDDPRPMPCDQPDPESCTNAGCMWGEDGCRPRPPACESLDRQVACDAREDCRWNNNRCEIDPGERTCEELDAMQCAEREDCGWSDEGCGPMPEGACGDLDYVECDMRPDCESNGCNCPPDVECDCENLCWPREFDCADVPIDACDRTPGCMVEEVCGEGGDGNAFAPGEDPAEPDPGRPAPPACEERCVVDEADRCAQLDERACIADPDCHVEYVVDCGGMGDADGDGAPDRVPCFEQAVCVEGGEDRVICAEIEDPRICAATDGCQLANECNCDELPPPDPADCGCEDGEPCPCLIAVPPCDCPICEDADGPPPGDCEGRDFEACVDDPSCEWIWAAEDLPAEGGGCMCWQDENGREICECVGIAPPAPDEGWCVDGDPPPPNMCEEIANPERCEATDGCQWVAVACGNCVVDDAGNEICPDCDDDGMGGFCTPDRVMPQGCEEHFDPDRCEADPNCAWEAFDCECFVGMDGEEICPPCPAPGGFCAWREVDPCERFDEAMCMDVDGCEWIPDGDDPGEPVEPVDPDEPMDDGRDNPAEPPADEAARPAPCPCEPGPDGEMICDCDPIEPPPPPLGGRCVTAPPAGDQCWAYGPDECEADPECGLLDNFGMGMPVDCPPCEPGEACPPCDALIAPALMCMPLEFHCASLPVEQCDPNRCAVEEREVCWGGGGPACPPGEACMDVPPPPDGGECFVERVCVSP